MTADILRQHIPFFLSCIISQFFIFLLSFLLIKSHALEYMQSKVNACLCLHWVYKGSVWNNTGLLDSVLVLVSSFTLSDLNRVILVLLAFFCCLKKKSQNCKMNFIMNTAACKYNKIKRDDKWNFIQCRKL